MAKSKLAPVTRPSAAPSARTGSPTGSNRERAGAPIRSRAPLMLGGAALVVVLVLTVLVLLRPHLASDFSAGGAVALPEAPTAEEQALLAAAAASPRDPAPARRLGDYYAGGARPFAALWAYAQALQVQPEDPEATLGLAGALEAGLFPEAAIERLQKLATRSPGQAEAAT